jgi:hypothetical protein
MKKCLLVLSLLAMTPLWAQNASAQSFSVWHSPLTAVTADADIILDNGSPSQALRISATSTGTHSVYFPLTLSSDVTIDAVKVCYQCQSSFSYIDEIRLVEIMAPTAIVTRLLDSTNQDNDGPFCYTTTTATTPAVYSPGGSLAIELVLNITDTDHRIDIGAIGVDVTPVP